MNNSMSESEKVASVVGCVAVFAAIPFHVLWSAWVVLHLWRWFAVPAFDAPPLSLPIVAGLEILVASQRAVAKPDDEKASFGRSFGYMFVAPAFWLLVGWIIKAAWL